MTRDLLRLSALEQARLIRTRAISSEELVRATIEQIERHNGNLTAFVQLYPDEALRLARQKDRELHVSRGEGLPPFHGIPMGIKDLNFVAGMFTRMGSRAFENFVAPFDDQTTKAHRRAGFVIIGKTATSELGAMPVTEPDIHEPARNPWNPDHSSGGSSGGAAAAVASGMLSVAHASDGAGSVRIPAAFCHCFGIKPSRGRLANAYGEDDRELIYTCGPISRTVRDAAAWVDAIGGISVGSPHWAPAPVKPFVEQIERPIPRLRVRFTHKTKLATTHPDHAAAVERLVKILADMGHIVEEGDPPDSGTVEEFLPVWQRSAATVPVYDWNETQPVTRWLAEHGKHVTDELVSERRADLAGRVVNWFGDVDLWVTPTVANPPPRVYSWRNMPPDEAFSNAAKLGPFTAPFNLSGQPAASIPMGLSSANLPIGVQIVGKPLADGLVLNVARQLEQVLSWDQVAPGYL